ncbi:hypothetical protein I79_000709 [Cricetulus griseus]|uniref:Uncharacterized protein n=1 Tax=Cricetulus griseus TaxID=10029 RepID=G3GST8_CRIGR|nr:hypothetical protein I79_000709 [Cricetulus griseus]
MGASQLFQMQAYSFTVLHFTAHTTSLKPRVTLGTPWIHLNLLLCYSNSLKR